MRRSLMLGAMLGLFAGPTVLAFHAGGYFDYPRVVAAGLTWLLVLGLAVAGPLPLPRDRAGQMALAGLVGLAVWSAVSLLWAPLIGPALDSVERLLLYIGVLLVAVALLRDERATRAVEPMLALGAVVVIGYGLSGRLLPGVIDLETARSFGAGGRLEQPITYWNSEGLLAAMGLVLCARVAGDRTRPAAMRVVAAAGCAPLGMGVYLSYSRGALAVALLALIVLLATAPSWAQLRAVVVGLATGVVAAAFSAAFPGVASLSGTTAEQQRDGAMMLAVVILVMLAGAWVTARVVRAEREGTARLGLLPRVRQLAAVAAIATALCGAVLVVGGLSEGADGRQSAGAVPSRFASVKSLRYEYWRVGAQAFWSDPLQGTGAGGFRVAWRMERRVNGAVTQVHSVVLEMAAELGIAGLAFLGLFLGGVAAAGRRALRRGAPLAPGACAVTVAWLLHATIDWDWQLPAVTLPALILAAGLLAASELPEPAPAAESEEPEPRREVRPLTVAAG
jgi:hypothetical protein